MPRPYVAPPQGLQHGHSRPGPRPVPAVPVLGAACWLPATHRPPACGGRASWHAPRPCYYGGQGPRGATSSPGLRPVAAEAAQWATRSPTEPARQPPGTPMAVPGGSQLAPGRLLGPPGPMTGPTGTSPRPPVPACSPHGPAWWPPEGCLATPGRQDRPTSGRSYRPGGGQAATGGHQEAPCGATGGYWWPACWSWRPVSGSRWPQQPPRSQLAAPRHGHGRAWWLPCGLWVAAGGPLGCHSRHRPEAWAAGGALWSQAPG